MLIDVDDEEEEEETKTSAKVTKLAAKQAKKAAKEAQKELDKAAKAKAHMKKYWSKPDSTKWKFPKPCNSGKYDTNVTPILRYIASKNFVTLQRVRNRKGKEAPRGSVTAPDGNKRLHNDMKV